MPFYFDTIIIKKRKKLKIFIVFCSMIENLNDDIIITNYKKV